MSTTPIEQPTPNADPICNAQPSQPEPEASIEFNFEALKTSLATDPANASPTKEEASKFISEALSMKLNHEAISMADLVFSRPELQCEDTFDQCAKAYNLAREPEKAFALLEVIKATTVNLHQFNSIIETGLKTRRFDEIEAIVSSADYSPVFKEGKLDPSVKFTMIKGYAKQSKLTRALELYNECKSDSTPIKNSYILNSLLEALLRDGQQDKALEIFTESLSQEVPVKNSSEGAMRPILDSYSFVVMMRAGEPIDELLVKMKSCGIDAQEEFFTTGLEQA